MNSTESAVDFDLSPYTSAALRMEGIISYQGHTAEQVFGIMGDPQCITDWYLLAKQVNMHPKVEGQEQTFNVEFTFFGDVFEEILHWDPPRRYVYLAKGPDFPIKDYISKIEIQETGPDSGVMSWQIYCDDIEGEEMQRILPVILPVINERSMHKLSELIGGVSCEVNSYFD